jgi:hypothetical protein
MSLEMMDYLIRKLGVSYDNFVQDPKILQDMTADDISADSMEGGLRPVWDHDTGRCTSFAMKIARMVTGEYLDSFHFDYYQLGSH